jgi:hypothetical protein
MEYNAVQSKFRANHLPRWRIAQPLEEQPERPALYLYQSSGFGYRALREWRQDLKLILSDVQEAISVWTTFKTTFFGSLTNHFETTAPNSSGTTILLD